ncbi:hypothetical protein A1O1_01025 [Capronia coronata CBS 617.96]|uniref:ABM domain-containing protein n=1 Tax=Capronia coronata CBS 617.96 TaxID=1182541 RepID=W9Z1U3_9EURO|nr:uncharacterized protein A1O1_01025 [Capronia coronata CBS 617.96]EXJ95900.1 hypothetical protein A1O1_01025 [Capronia coronata CBS 617.96]
MSTAPSLPSNPPNVMVVVSPNRGHEDRVAELIAEVSENVKAHEPWITYYRWYGGRGVGASDSSSDDDESGAVTEYYIVFRIEDSSKLSTRRELPHHQEIARLIRDEGLLREPLKYVTLEDREVWSR